MSVMFVILFYFYSATSQFSSTILFSYWWWYWLSYPGTFHTTSQCSVTLLLCFLFTLTASIIRRFAWNPVDQYGPQIQSLQRRNYGENPGILNPPLNSYIIDDPTALIPGFWPP